MCAPGSEQGCAKNAKGYVRLCSCSVIHVLESSCDKEMAGKSLAEKINALLTAKPDFGSDEEPEETKAKVVEHYNEDDVSEDEFQQSKIRKQNVDTLDKVDER